MSAPLPPTQHVWSQQLAVAIDTTSGAVLPPLLLMEHAGLAIYRQALRQGATHHKTIIIVGGGNNGGDALVAARLLHRYKPTVILLNAKQRSELNAEQLRIYLALTGTQQKTLLYCQGMLAQFEQRKVLVIDGIAGLGWRGEAQGEVQEIITAVNAMSAAEVLAIDIPSGLATDGNASINTALRANVTLTFGARKAVHVLAASRALCGTVQVADIGFPAACVRAAAQAHPPALSWVDVVSLLTAEPFTNLPCTAHKYQRGHVLVIGGSRGKYGAPLLSGLAALRSGAGLVSVALAQPDDEPPQGLPLELMYENFFQRGKVGCAQLAEFVTRRHVRVIVIGPGTVAAVINDALWEFLQKYTAEGGFVVIDAAAVSGVLGRKAARGVLLTPHVGEWERLGEAKLTHPQTIAQCAEVKRMAEAQGLHLVYKNACPLLFSAQASEPVYVCEGGDNSLAKAGSGDVLCGIIAAHLLAYGEVTPAFLTAYAQLAQRAQLLRARLGQHALLPSDLLAPHS